MLTYILLFIIILFTLLSLHRFFTAKYDCAYLPFNDRVQKEGVYMAMDYGDLLLLLNLLVDLQVELKRPFFLRFFRYPMSTARIAHHRKIISRFYQFLETLEVAHKEKIQ